MRPRTNPLLCLWLALAGCQQFPAPMAANDAATARAAYPRLLTSEQMPVLATHETTGIATSAELDARAARLRARAAALLLLAP